MPEEVLPPPSGFETAFVDLLAVCAAGPVLPAATPNGPTVATQPLAERLLARELVARLALGTRDFSSSGARERHFAVRVLDEGATGGTRAARTYTLLSRPDRDADQLHFPGSVSVPQEPGETTLYQDELDLVVPEASDLVADVEDAIGEAALAALALPYQTFLDARDELESLRPGDAGYDAARAAYDAAFADL